MKSITEVVFLRVPLPKSGDVVKYLNGIPQVQAAAAVYSDVDVVAVVVGTKGELDAVHDRFGGGEAPIASFACFEVDTVQPGTAVMSRSTQAACAAFVRCTIGTPAVSVAYASSVLSRVAGVVMVFSSAIAEEIILEVVASDKRSLDHTIMAVIQGEAGIVTSTRSYIVINAMQWRRD
jgi:hypothetical protein